MRAIFIGLSVWFAISLGLGVVLFADAALAQGEHQVDSYATANEIHVAPRVRPTTSAASNGNWSARGNDELSATAAGHRHISYGVAELLPAVFRGAADPAGRAMEPRFDNEQTPPHLALDRRVGGAVASVGLEHRVSGQVSDGRSANGLLAPVPTPSGDLVGAKISYRF